MADAADVNRLLESSREAHRAYRVAANPDSGRPNYPLAEQHVAKAHDRLKQAHELDPDHRSSGWAELRAPYDKLIDFYTRYPLIA
jgi:hypothetical protein